MHDVGLGYIEMDPRRLHNGADLSRAEEGMSQEEREFLSRMSQAKISRNLNLEMEVPLRGQRAPRAATQVFHSQTRPSPALPLRFDASNSPRMSTPIHLDPSPMGSYGDPVQAGVKAPSPVVPMRIEDRGRVEERVEEEIEREEEEDNGLELSESEKEYNSLLKEANQRDWSAYLDKEIVYKAGIDHLGRQTVVAVAAHMSLLEDIKDLLLFLIYVMDPIVNQPYVVVYCHTQNKKSSGISFSWMRRVYGLFQRKYKKNLKSLYILHASFWVKATLRLFKAFISAKFWNKLVYCSSVQELSQYVRKDQIKLPYFVLEKEGMDTGVMRDPVFGIPLEQVVEKLGEVEGIPTLVYDMLTYMNQEEAMKTQGVYRVSGSRSTICTLRDTLDEGGKPSLAEVEDVHAVSGLLKLFFRELPEPLLTYALHEPLKDLFTQLPKDGEDKWSLLEAPLLSLLQQLPVLNRNTLRHVMSHISNVSKWEADNMMGASNLAIIFGPTLMRGQTVDVLKAMEETAVVNSLMKLMIEHADALCEGLSQ